MKNYRDQIQYPDSTNYVIGCYSRGRIFAEYEILVDCQNLMDDYPCLAMDDYAIYTVEEWNRGN